MRAFWNAPADDAINGRTGDASWRGGAVGRHGQARQAVLGMRHHGARVRVRVELRHARGARRARYADGRRLLGSQAARHGPPRRRRVPRGAGAARRLRAARHMRAGERRARPACPRRRGMARGARAKGDRRGLHRGHRLGALFPAEGAHALGHRPGLRSLDGGHPASAAGAGPHVGLASAVLSLLYLAFLVPVVAKEGRCPVFLEPCRDSGQAGGGPGPDGACRRRPLWLAAPDGLTMAVVVISTLLAFILGMLESHYAFAGQSLASTDAALLAIAAVVFALFLASLASKCQSRR